MVVEEITAGWNSCPNDSAADFRQNIVETRQQLVTLDFDQLRWRSCTS
jgi:hypothetical protein